MSVVQASISDEARGERKRRGAFFTPLELADYMSRWAIRKDSDSVLEPSCGDSAFLYSAGNRLRGMGQLLPNLVGYDVHEPSVKFSTNFLREEGLPAQIQCANFLKTEPSDLFDVVLGNPPYIRFQDIDEAEQKFIVEMAKSHGVKLSRLANAWAAFVIHASSFLKEDGRLGFVLPAVLLTVNYARPVRRFLMNRFANVKLVMFDERVFPGVMEEVVLLLAEGSGGTSHIEIEHHGDLDSLKSETALEDVSMKVTPKKWSAALVAPSDHALFKSIANGKTFTELENWGSIELGTVTGNNKYFTLTAEEVRERGLESDVVRVSPPGSKHLTGLTLSKRYLDSLDRTFLFYPSEPLSEAASKYIRLGEELDVHTGYKCRNRSPWWRVPLTAAPDLIFTYMSGEAPKFVANEAGAHVLNSVHGVRVSGKGRDVSGLLPLAFMNSVSLAGAELKGRSYGGGILKVEPGEAKHLPVPTWEALENASTLIAARPQIVSLLTSGKLEDAVRRVDDAFLVRDLGLNRDDVGRMRKMWLFLKKRRANRGSGPK
jgi:adenine-specific DNA methylase